MRLLLLALVMMLFSLSSAVAGVKDFFPTGVWYFWEDDASYINRHVDDPARARDYYESTMLDLANHHVSLIIANWTPRDHRMMMLEAARKKGIKVIVHLDEANTIIAGTEPLDSPKVLDTLRGAVAGIKDHPAVLGYYLVDEPGNSPEVAQRIAAVKKLVETLDPKHPGFSCLLGGYEDLLKIVDYRVLLIDIYPIGVNWSGDFSGYISELERGHQNAGDRPLWVIPQAFGKENAWKIPTSAEVRAQVWQAIACGARGIVYFIYQSTTGIQGEWLKGMVGMDLKPMDDRLEDIGKINSDIATLSPLLLTLKRTDDKLDLPATVLAHTFTDPTGSRYVILANRSAARPIYFKSPFPLATDVLTGAKITSGISLEPGAGKVLKID